MLEKRIKDMSIEELLEINPDIYAAINYYFNELFPSRFIGSKFTIKPNHYLPQYTFAVFHRFNDFVPFAHIQGEVNKHGSLVGIKISDRYGFKPSENLSSYFNQKRLQNLEKKLKKHEFFSKIYSIKQGEIPLVFDVPYESEQFANYCIKHIEDENLCPNIFKRLNEIINIKILE